MRLAQVTRDADTSQENTTTQSDGRKQRRLRGRVVRVGDRDREPVSGEDGRGFVEGRRATAVNRLLYEPVEAIGLGDDLHVALLDDGNAKDVATTIMGDGIPPLRAAIAIDADTVGVHIRLREVGQDQRHMTGLRDHRVIAIGVALPLTAGMHVDVGDDANAPFGAPLPQCAKMATVEANDAGIQ